MLFYYRLLLLFLITCTFTSLFSILYKDNYFYLGALICVLVAFIGTYLLINKKLKNWRQSASYSFFSLLLLLSGIFYLVFVEDLIVKIGIIVLTNLLFFIYLNELLKQLFVPRSDGSEKQTQIFLLVEAVIVFFISAGFLGLRDFLNISLITLLVPFILLIVILVYYLVFNNVKLGLNKIYFSLILALVMAELFWAMAVLSLVYYLKGLIISFFYLLVMEFVISSLLGKGFNKMVRSYLIIILIVLGIILYSSRWF